MHIYQAYKASTAAYHRLEKRYLDLIDKVVFDRTGVNLNALSRSDEWTDDEQKALDMAEELMQECPTATP